VGDAYMERDINLLFGVFAVQLNKVNAIQLMEAAGAWAVEPSRGIPERLVAARALSEAQLHWADRTVGSRALSTSMWRHVPGDVSARR
jgi:hypothetical protein